MHFIQMRKERVMMYQQKNCFDIRDFVKQAVNIHSLSWQKLAKDKKWSQLNLDMKGGNIGGGEGGPTQNE